MKNQNRRKHMAMYIAAGLLSAGVLMGCGQQATAAEPVSAAMTQPIQTTAALLQGGQETSASGMEKETVKPSGDLETDLSAYARLKAEEEAAEIDIDNLEAAFRVGSIDQESLKSQKAELIQNLQGLERQADILENAIDLAYYEEKGSSLPEGDIKSLLSEKLALESQQSQNELLQEQLEYAYRNGETEREEFIQEYAGYVRTEEELDRREELLENALELQGYDD